MRELDFGDLSEADFLARCTASSTQDPIVETIRDRSAEVLLALHRLVKISLTHPVSDGAVTGALEKTRSFLASFAASVGRPASITYAHQAVFVSGELLRGSRAVFAAARELGELLARCGVSEVSFAPELTSAQLFAFVEATSASIRNQGQQAMLLQARIDNVGVRALDAALHRREDERELSLRERTIRAYASALLVIRQFYAAVASGARMPPHRAKRVAQRLVALAEESEAMLLGAATMAQAQRDDAARAAHAAILALVLARRLTRDRVTLSQLVLTALVAEAGRVQVARAVGLEGPAPLPDDAVRAVPPCSSAAALVTGGLNRVTALRAIVSYETTWLEREDLLGPLYGDSFEPVMPSILLRLARSLTDLMVPRDDAPALSPFDAVSRIAEASWVDASLLRLVTAALGYYPVGTVVELESGEWGVVTGPSEAPGSAHLPRLRLMTDGRGRAMDDERYVDLGEPTPPREGRKIVRVVSPAEAGFNIASAFASSAPVRV